MTPCEKEQDVFIVFAHHILRTDRGFVGNGDGGGGSGKYFIFG